MHRLDELLQWYATLTEQNVSRVSEFYHETARFQDPFNDVRGHAAIVGIFRHMFETVAEPRFRIESRQMVADTAWVAWTFEFGLRGRRLSIAGATQLAFGGDGRVALHKDYWDATELFGEFPLLGGVMRVLKRRLRAPGAAPADRR